MRGLRKILQRFSPEAHFDTRNRAERVNADTNDTRAPVCECHFRWTGSHARTHARGKQEGVDSFTAAVNSIDGFSSCQSAFLLPRERVDRPLFRARVSRADLPVYERAVTTHARTMKYRVMSRLPTTMMCVVVLAMTEATASPTEPLPSVLLGGIGNVANTATNFRESIQMTISMYRLGEFTECSTNICRDINKLFRNEK